ncbi:MAG: hypothetical protein Q9207_001537 [Kuettlingeria erythrocarpa]
MHKSFSTVRKAVDFHAIEAKWKTIWATKESELDKNRYRKDDFRPPSPLRFSILGIGNRYSDHGRHRIEGSSSEECGFFGSRLPFATPKESNEFLRLREIDQQLKLCIRDHGLDLVRTSLAVGAQGSQMPHCNVATVSHTRQWFESIWEATSIAHTSYHATQAQSSVPDIPEALYEPGIDSWTEYLTDEPKSLVHIPPREPDLFDHDDTNEEGERVWLAAQEALISTTQTISPTDDVQQIKEHLTTLTTEIIQYNDAYQIYHHVQYHAARVLINLIAAFAPSFAEECWVLLHYGSSSFLGVYLNAAGEEGKVDDEDDDRKPPRREEIESILVEAEEK